MFIFYFFSVDSHYCHDNDHQVENVEMQMIFIQMQVFSYQQCLTKFPFRKKIIDYIRIFNFNRRFFAFSLIRYSTKICANWYHFGNSFNHVCDISAMVVPPTVHFER